MAYVKQVLLAVLLVLSGCLDLWVPDLSDGPVKVNVGDDLSEQQREALLEACQRINDTAGFRVLRPVVDNGRRIQRGRIHVDQASIPAIALARAQTDAWSCHIRSGKLDQSADTYTHELMHCLGFAHEEDPESIMFPTERKDLQQHIMPSHVAYLRDMANVDSGQ